MILKMILAKEAFKNIVRKGENANSTVSSLFINKSSGPNLVCGLQVLWIWATLNLYDYKVFILPALDLIVRWGLWNSM